MGKFHWIGFSCPDLTTLMVVSKYKFLLHLSIIKCCNGITIGGWFRKEELGLLEGHKFLHKQLTNTDFTLWQVKSRSLTSSELLLPCCLGPFLQELHIIYEWTTTAGEDTLFR